MFGLSAEILPILRDQSVKVEPAKETRGGLSSEGGAIEDGKGNCRKKLRRKCLSMSNVANKLGKLRTDS